MAGVTERFSGFLVSALAFHACVPMLGLYRCIWSVPVERDLVLINDTRRHDGRVIGRTA